MKFAFALAVSLLIHLGFGLCLATALVNGAYQRRTPQEHEKARGRFVSLKLVRDTPLSTSPNLKNIPPKGTVPPPMGTVPLADPSPMGPVPLAHSHPVPLGTDPNITPMGPVPLAHSHPVQMGTDPNISISNLPIMSIFTEPKLKDELCLSYPSAARRRGITGEVTIVAGVDATGAVTSVLVEKSSGDAALDEGACRAVREASFIPATRAGERCEAKVRIPVKFELK